MNWLPTQLGNYATYEVGLDVVGEGGVVIWDIGSLSRHPAQYFRGAAIFSENPRILNMLISQYFSR